MRIIAAAVLFAAATVSSASAQQSPAPAPASAPAPQISFSMDHGRAADAAAATAAANAKAAAIAAAQPSQSQPASFSVNGDNVIRAAPPLTPEQQKADEDGRAAWQARCRPAIAVDRDGMRRTKYAEPDCDLSRFNTAGQ
jgi:hypothetical protein